MAKIYETQEDFERDRLSKEAASARESQSSFLQNGMLSTLLGSANITIGARENEIRGLKTIQNEGWLSRNMGRLNYGIGLAFAALGIVELITSFSSRKKAIKAEEALAKLGPEQVVMPHTCREGNNASNRVYGMDDVQIIPDPSDPKKATVKMNLDPADFKDLEDKLNTDKTVNWQKKVDGENKTISLTAQKQ